MTTFTWSQAKQISIPKLLLAFVIPCGFIILSFYLIMPLLAEIGLPVLVAYPIMVSFCLLPMFLAGIILLAREAKQLGISFKERSCLKKIGYKDWLLLAAVVIIAMVLASGATLLSKLIISGFSLKIPSFLPFFLNPAIDPATTPMDQLSPGYPLTGNFIPVILIGLAILINSLAEEFFFRAYLLPKMERFGKGSWVLLAVLFTLYHVFQFWMYPPILVGSLAYSFMQYRTKSIVPCIVAHFVLNFLVGVISVLSLVLK